MKQCVLLLLACVCAHGAPLEPGMVAGSCQDAFAVSAAGLALTKINEDRHEGYVFSLHRLNNVNQMQHGESGIVFYLTLDVVETSCHVLSKKNWKKCAVRETSDTPVYGQCKAVIYINRPQRVVRLYNYNCVVRPVSATKIHEICPDCPSASDKEDQEIVKAATLSIEKFNKDHGLANHFALLNITRASSSYGGMAMFYFVEYTIQETTCANTTDPAQAAKCPLMGCEFAHKGLCKASHHHSHHGMEHPPVPDVSEDPITVDCEVFEPESAEKEKKLHLLGGKNDHDHTDTHAHDPKHDQVHDTTEGHTHDHAHDHTKGHVHNDTHTHADGSEHHHHTHAHADGSEHDHVHTHDHGHDHDHEHTHHAKAHDHSQDSGPNHHHQYVHTGEHTHEHDHELALDHDHKHGHLHAHEHHHHHHDHDEKTQRHPEGSVRVLPALDRPMTLPAFPDQESGAEKGVTLPLVQDPEIPGEREPTILPFPSAASPQCPAPFKDGEGNNFMKVVFAEDPLFKAAA